MVFTFLGNTTAIQEMFKRFAEVPIVTGLLCRGGGVDFHGAPRVDLTRRDGGNDTPGVSSLRCTSSASSCGWHTVWILGFKIRRPQTSLAAARPTLRVRGKTVVTLTHRRTTPHSLDLFEMVVISVSWKGFSKKGGCVWTGHSLTKHIWTDTLHTRLSRTLGPCPHITLWLKVSQRASDKIIHAHVITCFSVRCLFLFCFFGQNVFVGVPFPRVGFLLVFRDMCTHVVLPLCAFACSFRCSLCMVNGSR